MGTCPSECAQKLLFYTLGEIEVHYWSEKGVRTKESGAFHGIYFLKKHRLSLTLPRGPLAPPHVLVECGLGAAKIAHYDGCWN